MSNEITNPKLIFFIVIILSILALTGMTSTVVLIWHKTDPIAIALVSTMTGTIIGNLASMLTQLRGTPTTAVTPTASITP